MNLSNSLMALNLETNQSFSGCLACLKLLKTPKVLSNLMFIMKIYLASIFQLQSFNFLNLNLKLLLEKKRKE